MNVLKRVQRLLADPPPVHAFEISGHGIAWSRRVKRNVELGFEPLDPDILHISPLHNNVIQPDALYAHVRALAPNNGKSKRRTAALILPDYSARIAVLDFADFPSAYEEQLSLVRFRMKKSIPFDLESAHVSFYVQSGGGGKKYEVVAAAAALEIVARYEAAFRRAEFDPGFVTTSTLAALHLVSGDGLSMLAKLSGSVLTAAVAQGQHLRLVRCVELAEVSADEIARVLYPTFAFCEDSFGALPERTSLCGFGDWDGVIARQIAQDFGIEANRLQSRLGEPGETNAGLLGYLEAIGE